MRYKMGDLVELVTEKNSDLKYGLEDIVGVTLEKQMIPTIANLTQTDLDDFIIVHPMDFVYNPRTHGKKIGLGFNTSNRCYISTWNNNTFRVKSQMKDTIIPEFLYLHFLRDRWDKEACFHAWGSSTVVLLWSSFCDMGIDVPPLPEQQKIVRDYQVITARKKLLWKINDSVEAVIQAMFEQMFFEGGIQLNEAVMKQGDLPDKWTSTTIGQMCSVQTGPFGSQLHNEDYVSEGTPIITVEHLNGKYIAHRNLPMVSEEDYNRLEKYNLRTGDIVFSRVGSVDRAVIVSNFEDKWLFSGRCLRVRPNNPNHATYYLWWFSQSVIKQLVTASAVGTTMPSINTTILSDIKVIVPPSKSMEAFCNQASLLSRTVWNNNAEIRSLEEMQLMIMSKRAD